MQSKHGKYSKVLANQIINLIKSDTYTVSEICRMVHITKTTFYNWQSKHPEFAEAVRNAQDELNEILVCDARRSLKKKVNGYEVKETKIVTVPGEKDENGNPKPKIKEQITTTKHIPPDTTAIIFTLTNGDPEHWKNRQSSEVTGKDGKDLFASMPDDKLDIMINELKRKLELDSS